MSRMMPARLTRGEICLSEAAILGHETMSQMGHTRRFCPISVRSGQPLRADTCRRRSDIVAEGQLPTRAGPAK